LDSETLQPKHISIEIRSGDAWLPSSIWVIGLPIQGSPMLILGQPRWPDKQWFSTQTTDAGGQARPERWLDEGLKVPF
jgi:hypothetical protein